MTRKIAFTAGVGLLLMAGLGTPSAHAADGWYSQSQATAGARDYGANCASCHGPKLKDGAARALESPPSCRSGRASRPRSKRTATALAIQYRRRDLWWRDHL